MRKLFLLSLLFSTTLPAQTITTPGWHRIASASPSYGTSVCGGGSQNNPTFADPNGFYNYGFNFTDQCYAMITDSNSGIMDTTRHRFIYFGGGHQIYWGSDTWSLELTEIGGTKTPMHHLSHSGNANFGGCPATGPASTTVTESNGAVCGFGSDGTIGHGTVVALAAPVTAQCTFSGLASGCPPTQLSTPGSVHTYDGIVYVPLIYSGGNTFGDYMLLLGGISSPSGNTLSTGWTLSMSSVPASCAISATNPVGCNPVWTPLGGPAGTTFWNPGGGGSAGQVADWDATTQTVWIQTQTNLFQFNPVTSTITQKSTTPVFSHAGGAFDPLHKYLILVGDSAIASRVQYINIGAGGTYPVVTPTLTGCSGFSSFPTGTQYSGIVWDEIDQRMVIFPNQGNTLYILNPATWTCTTESYGTTGGVDFPFGPDVSQGGTVGTFGHFRRDPALDLFILCGTATQVSHVGGDTKDSDDCWYLRRRR